MCEALYSLKMQLEQLKKKICILLIEFADFNLSTKTYSTTLSWKAYTEMAFDRYVVLYSKNGVDFTEIGSVKGKGNQSNYTFNYPHQGEAYFKLKAVDKNGQFEYSKVLYSKGNTFAIKVGLHPFSDNLTITGLPEGLNTITFYSLRGAGIKTQTVNGAEAVLSLATLSPGKYLLKINHGNSPFYSGLFVK